MTGSPGAPRGSDARPLRVALDVRVPAGQWGGIQKVVEGLARGLSQLEGLDEFLFIGYEDAASWLDPLLAGRCRRVEVPRTFARSRRRRLYEAVAQPAPWAARLIGSVGGRLGGVATPIPRSDGFLESIGVDVVHFVAPQAYLTSVPSIYHVHDLLHEHLPEFFSPLHRRYRAVSYQAFADQASMISTMASWIRDDIVARMGIPRSKIAVVPFPPVLTPEAVGAAAMPRSEGGEEYVLFPAQTWPHKNHLTLLDAMAKLRDDGSPVRLECTGRLTEHHATLRRRIQELRLDDLVTFRGYVDDVQLAALYANARAVVFPSRFEGWGIPIVEAFAWGVPVACSNIPVLHEAGQGATLEFDPLDAKVMSEAIGRVTRDEVLRAQLVAAGRRRAAGLSWPGTARAFRALYRKVAGLESSSDDRALLEKLMVT